MSRGTTPLVEYARSKKDTHSGVFFGIFKATARISSFSLSIVGDSISRSSLLMFPGSKLYFSQNALRVNPKLILFDLQKGPNVIICLLDTML